MATNESIEKQLQEQQKKEGTPEKQEDGNRSVKGLLESENIKGRFDEILKERAPQYLSSIITLVNNDDMLKKADPYSVITSAMIAATLDLPIEKNLGFAYIIPYYDKNTKGQIASFQLGYKGLIQLALRTSQYKAINVTEIYEGELQEFNRLTEYLEIDQGKKLSNKVTGYAAYFELLNGFKKYVYWTADEIEGHKQKFSKGGNVWRDNYDAMAKKTVIKNMLSKWGILSVQMQDGLINDSADPLEHRERKEIKDLDVIDQ